MLGLNLDVQPRNLSPLFHQENFELVKLELLLFCCFFFNSKSDPSFVPKQEKKVSLEFLRLTFVRLIYVAT